MPTLETLIKRGKYLVDDNIESDTIIEAFNECLEDLSAIANYEVSATIPMEAGVQQLALPDDCMEVVRIRIRKENEDYLALCKPLKNQDDAYGFNAASEIHMYRQFGSTITIEPKITKNYEVLIDYYGSIPPVLSIQQDPSLQGKPKIPERFHRALPLFFAVRYFENWEDNSEMRKNFQGQYDVIKQQYSIEAQQRKTKTRSNQVQIVEGWY